MGVVLKIGFCGAHGTGKTTLALKTAATLKEAYPYMRVGIVTEVARECPWPISRRIWPDGQHWIFHQQWVRELEAAKRNNAVICDRTVLDAVVYAAESGVMGTDVSAWGEVVRQWWPTYDMVYLLAPSGAIAADGVREMDAAYQRRIHERFEELISRWGLAVERPGDTKDIPLMLEQKGWRHA